MTRDITAGLTQAGTVVGTPMWMAPEQARGRIDRARRATSFSLGATLMFAATGEVPYASGPANMVMGRAAREQIRPVPGTLPGALRAVLVRMLDPRAERRPSAAGVLGGSRGDEDISRPPSSPVDEGGPRPADLEARAGPNARRSRPPTGQTRLAVAEWASSSG